MSTNHTEATERLVTSIPQRLGLTRRQFVQMAAAALAWCAAPGRFAGVARAEPPTDPVSVQTLEALADTLIPGAKRSPDDRAIAGASTTPGAVAAGALTLMYLPEAGLEQFLSLVVSVLNAEAITFAAAEGIALDSSVPAFVSLDLQQRTDVLVHLFATPGLVQPILVGVAALPFIAFYTAGHLPTPDAVRTGHPGLASMGFPQPDPDDLWRFPEFSYRRRLARRHPGTRKGSPL